MTDSTGGVLPKAKIIVHNVEKNTDVTTTTTSTGDFAVPYLTPGVYDVSVEAPSFKKEIRSHITLEVGQTATLNFALTVGAVSESVVVNSDGAILDYGKADRGEVVENTRVTELPLNGRDPGMLSILNAGAIWTGSIQWQRPFDDTQANLSINGGGSGNNEMMLDGVSNESAVGGNSKIAYVPPVDAVQEFKIVTNPYDAQYGRASGGVVDMTLKSGTNRVHGDIYEFARRSWLDANTWQNDYLNSVNHTNRYAKSQHKLDQYGGELDGPVFIPKVYDGRNKSFFVLQYENWNEKVPNSLVTSVPDPAWLTGDFSNLTWWDGSKYAPMTIYDPLTIHDDGTGRLVRDPFPGNKIPTARINPVALKMLSYYPKPNSTPPPASNPFANNYATPNPTTDRYRNVIGKWVSVWSRPSGRW
ncbi:MAG TPA: carboxypeptidase regulatory-like domain-containing protein [Acidisarcina sp.]|nr:carboxypeptidase regulatory-like domain-containing protein [Acidisarcina sp.]